MLDDIIGGGGGLVCDSVGKAHLLSNRFDGKQSRESVDLTLACHPSHRLTTFALSSSEVRRLLLDLDPYGVTGRLCMFSRELLMFWTSLRILFSAACSSG